MDTLRASRFFGWAVRLGIAVAVGIAIGCDGTGSSEQSPQPVDTGPRAPSLTPSPWITAVQPRDGFNDEPALALTDAGGVYVGWLSFTDGTDTLVISRYQHEGDRFLPLDHWTVLGGRGTYILGLQAVATDSGAYFVYSREVDGNWDIFALEVDASGPKPPVAIASGPETQIKPSAVWADGTLHVAWESNPESNRQIFWASVRNGVVTEAQQVSLASDSNYGPSVAVPESGRVSVAWHSYRDHNYDIFLRQRASSGTWESPRRLTVAPAIDRHAQLLARGDDLWIVYEHALMEKYHVGRTNERHLVVAQVTPSGLVALLPTTGTPRRLPPAAPKQALLPSTRRAVFGSRFNGRASRVAAGPSMSSDTREIAGSDREGSPSAARWTALHRSRPRVTGCSSRSKPTPSPTPGHHPIRIGRRAHVHRFCWPLSM